MTPAQWDGELAITALKPSKTNPRGKVTDAGLEELTESIRQYGILVRLLVRPLGKEPRIEGGHWEGIRGWEIVLGERRWRAAKLAGLDVVPVTVRILSDAEARAIQVIERGTTEIYRMINRTRDVRTVLRMST